MPKLDLLQQTIQYQFVHPHLLEEALTHPCVAIESTLTPHYERLEFLGDAVLSLVTSEWLYTTFKGETEGDLAQRRAALVCGPTLSLIAENIGLGDHLTLTKGEEKLGGRTNSKNLENALEALLGAIYLDGGLEPAQAFFNRFMAPIAETVKTPPKDAKSFLQEWLQQRSLELPVYRTLTQTGASHMPLFTIEASALLEDGEQRKAVAEGTSKQRAEQAAAELLLEQLQAIP